MSQIPPAPAPVPYAPAPQRTSGMAIASLICGILMCVPLIAPLLGIIFGILGINQARRPGVSGKGLAIAGIILGVLGLLLQLGFVGFGGWGYMRVKSAIAPYQNATHGFVQDLSNGNVNAAQAKSGLSRAELTALSEQLKGLGTFQSASAPSINFDNGAWELRGTLQFSQGSRRYRAVLSTSGGQPRITSFVLE